MGANPKEWFVSLEPIPEDQWEAVEVLAGGIWAPATEKRIGRIVAEKRRVWEEDGVEWGSDPRGSSGIECTGGNLTEDWDFKSE